MGVEAEGVWKSSTVFPAGSMMGLVKTLTFFRKGPFEVKAEYADESGLLPLTPKELGTYKIDVPAQTEAKKVKVRVKLTLHGTFQVEGAQLVEEETYEEVVKEKRELPPSPEQEEEAPAADAAGQPQEGEPAPAAEAEAKPEAKPEAKEETAPEDADKSAENGASENGADKAEEKPEVKSPAKEEEKKKEPKFEWVEVKKTKTRTKKTDLKVATSGTPGIDEATLQRLMDNESHMQAEMKEIIETDERKNDLESYIFNMRDKVSEGSVYGAYISSAARDTFNSELTQAEDWLYDTMDATKTMYIDKLDELKKTGDAVAWRCKEAGMRDEWVQAVIGTVSNYRSAAESPGDKFGHIAAEKLTSIVTACNELEDWLNEMKEKQEKMPKYEKPVLFCAEMEKKNQELAKMADEILKEPKPAPPKEEKMEEPAKGDKSDSEEKREEDGEAPAEEAKQEEPAKNGADMEVD